MLFTKHLEYKPNKQIWRILITDDENIVIEKRDTSDKQVYFDCFSLESKKEIFSNLQLDEKFWIGIEKIYKGVIFFHLFAKPDMPGHKEIIAYDISSNEVLWRNKEHSYLFLYEDKVYCFRQLFEGRQFYTLNYKTGELLDDLGTDTNKVNADYDKSRQEEDYSKFIFPETAEPKDSEVKSILNNLKSTLAIVGDVEYNVLENVLLASYHIKQHDDTMANKFGAVNIETGETIVEELLYKNTDSFMTDSFFVYKVFLFLLKGKEEIVIHKIE